MWATCISAMRCAGVGRLLLFVRFCKGTPVLDGKFRLDILERDMKKAAAAVQRSSYSFPPEYNLIDISLLHQHHERRIMEVEV